jgi:hypothetical protein
LIIKELRVLKTELMILNIFLNSVKDNSLWEYNGFTVEIDPTVDYGNSNVLVRWRDVDEGFNDKTIYYTLAEFKKDFKLLN